MAPGSMRWIIALIRMDYDYYWMVGEYRNDEPETTDTDQWAVNHGYIAITPTKIDVTDYDWLKNFEL